MRCPICGGERLAMAAVPGEAPERLHVCLTCAHLWTPPEDPRSD